MARGLHLAQHVEQKEQGAVVLAGQAGAEATGVALLFVLGPHDGVGLGPVHAEGRVGDEVVHAQVGMAVVGEAVGRTPDVVRVLPLDQHVRLADGVGLGVQLLPEDLEPGVGVQLGQVLLGHAQHAAGAAGRVVHGAHDAGLAEGVVVLHEEEVDHEPDDLAGREVLPGGLVALLGELADQLLEDVPHLQVGDAVGVEVHRRELLHDQVQDVGLVEPLDLGLEAEVVDDVAGVGREAVDVAHEVGGDVRGVGQQALEVELRGVVEALAAGLEQHALPEGLGAVLEAVGGVEHGLPCGSEHLVEAAEHGEGQDDPAVLGLLVVAAKDVGDGPDEGDLLGETLQGGTSWSNGGCRRSVGEGSERHGPRPRRDGSTCCKAGRVADGIWPDNRARGLRNPGWSVVGATLTSGVHHELVSDRPAPPALHPRPRTA